MYFYSSKAFEGEFYKSGDYVDATVIVSSDLFGQVEDYATKLKNALIYFATNYTGSPAYVFGNVEDITGNLGLNSGRTPETVPIALDLQIAFERQSDNPVILTISDKEYSDSLTAAGIAEHIKDLRDAVVESQYGSTALSVEFLPVQISAVVRETVEAPVPPVPPVQHNITLYGAYNDIIEISLDGTVIETVTFDSGYSEKTISLEYVPDKEYKFESQVAIIDGNNYSVNVTLTDNDTTVRVRPEYAVYWFGYTPAYLYDLTYNFYTISSGDNYIQAEYPYGNSAYVRISYSGDSELSKINFYAECELLEGTVSVQGSAGTLTNLTTGLNVSVGNNATTTRQITFRQVDPPSKFRIKAVYYTKES